MSETPFDAVSERFFLPTEVSSVSLYERKIFVKRDDLTDPCLSGNKYRKLFSLLNTPSQHYRRIVSYGGSQSNAMLALACLCRLKGWEFVYHTKTLSAHLRENPGGNLEMALNEGMVLKEVPHEQWRQQIQGLHTPLSDAKTLLVAQGGADPLAEAGIARLAEEVRQWFSKSGLRELGVVTPSGTGTTAYYLARHLSEHRVYTAPAVGDAAYLREQMAALGGPPANLRILQTATRYRFASPHPELAEVFRQLEGSGVAFDLLYAPVMFKALQEHLATLPDALLYIHSGGVSGNVTMLQRYQHKGML